MSNVSPRAAGIEMDIVTGFTAYGHSLTNQFVYLGFYVAFNTVQVISQRVVGRAEETST